jgi:SAM-dependent methyltransferase
MNDLANNGHLGGHAGRTHIDEGTLRCLQGRLPTLRSMLDIGCGPGGMENVASRLGIRWTGVDGDARVEPTFCWDFTSGTFDHSFSYDLAWSVEFVEHVEERFLPNCLKAFQLCDHVFMTHAPPGKHGHHHVNCRSHDYWLGAFAAAGFDFDPNLTSEIRAASTMGREFTRNTGLVFHRHEKCHLPSHKIVSGGTRPGREEASRGGLPDNPS